MQYIIHLETIRDPRPTAVLRLRATLPDLPKIVPQSCGQVWKLIRDQQVQGAGRHVALYLDDEMNLEVGVELERPAACQVPLIASTLPAGRVATTTHLGPYPQLAKAHQAIREWCAQNNHTPAGPNWELYGHWQDDWNNNPSNIRTDIHYVIK